MGGVYKCERFGALGRRYRDLQSGERFCGGMRYLWRIRSHVQAVPRCPYARQRYHRRDARHVRASSSFRGNWRC